MEKHLHHRGILKRYNTLLPSTKPIPHGQSVNTSKGVQRVLKDMRTFKTVYGGAMEYLTNGYGFFLAFDDPIKHSRARKLMEKALWRDGQRVKEWAEMYEHKARDLIKTRKWGLTGVSPGGLGGSAYVDVVRDVLKVVPVHWVCEEIVSI
jgi:cytochrome P450